MSKKIVQIATLGIYANERVRYVSLKRQADEIVLLYSPENKEQMEEIVRLYKQDRLPIEVVCVKAWKYESILAEILELIVKKQKKNHIFEFNISCGTTPMRVACHMAAVLTHSQVHFVSEKDGDLVGELETAQPLSFSQLTTPKKNILMHLVDEGGCIKSQRELGSRVNLHASSISRHVKDLMKFGYLTTITKSGKNMIQITDLGRAIIRLKQVRTKMKEETLS